ncbi:MAG: CpsB/CapC family capsule biosynthesis tyrosine phosphatase [Bacteroidota bacterium]
MALFSRHRTPAHYSVDIHSHLLPGIDDGVETWEQSLTILRELSQLGFTKAVTTPHILAEFYPNSPDTILPLRDELRKHLEKEGIPIEIEAAAEYYVDESFMELLESSEELLCFGDKKYVLFETGFLNEPRFLREAIFQMKSKGYQPLMAHPERYTYFQENPALLNEYHELTLFQVNVLSFMGYYSSRARSIVKQLAKANQITFLGSDLHKPKQLTAYREAIGTKLYRKVLEHNLRNNSLL